MSLQCACIDMLFCFPPRKSGAPLVPPWEFDPSYATAFISLKIWPLLCLHSVACFSTFVKWDLLPQNQHKVVRNTWWSLSVLWVFKGSWSPSTIPSVWHSWVSPTGDGTLKTHWKLIKTIRYFWRLCPGFVGTGLICAKCFVNNGNNWTYEFWQCKLLIPTSLTIKASFLDIVQFTAINSETFRLPTAGFKKQ